MEFTSISGLVAGLGLVTFGIIYSPSSGVVLREFLNFFDLPSIFITFGGTIASTLIAFPISYFENIPKQLKIAVQRKKYIPQDYINKIVGYVQEARKKGLLSLEDMANRETDWALPLQYLREAGTPSSRFKTVFSLTAAVLF